MRLDLIIDWPSETSDAWFTPPHIFTALKIKFDLDPCAPKGGVMWVPATEHYSEDDDGLSQPWEGRVWMNPPYSNPTPWVRKISSHKDGVALLPADTSTAWWHDYASTGDAFCFIRGRLRFVRNTGAIGEMNASFASVLIGWGEPSARAVRSCELGWVPL